MEKNQIAKGIEMVESERKIRDALIAKSEKDSEELHRIVKEAKTLDGSFRDKELSRSSKRELSKYARHLEALSKLATDLGDFNAILKTTKAERAEPVRGISV